MTLWLWFLRSLRAVGSRMHDAIERATESMVSARLSLRHDKGQTVAEYALVLLVAAAIAAAFLLWARQSGKLDAFFDLIFDKLVNSVDPSATPAP